MLRFWYKGEIYRADATVLEQHGEVLFPNGWAAFPYGWIAPDDSFVNKPLTEWPQPLEPIGWCHTRREAQCAGAVVHATRAA